MQPYVNPYLFSNPMYSNYGQQPMPQQMAQPVQQVAISGRYVNDFNEINLSDIPMNSPAIFAKNDRSEIQLREWNSNGQIVTTSYKAIVEEPPAPVVEQPTFNLDPIIEKLAELEEKIDKIPKTSTARAKKDGE